jgi:SAM-dependent methyltransferase
MTQKLEYRLNYHPDFTGINQSDRKVKQRLDIILNSIDFKDKVVLDLGCSGGYFSFSLSKYAKKIIAVDADEEIIKKNKRIQSELGINNIEFICENIDSKLIENILDPIDVVLFLSVFHHILSNSEAYDWNLNKTSFDGFGLIEKINSKTQNLFFEMGLPNEGYEWCGRLPFMGKNRNEWEEWIFKNIFRDQYSKIIKIDDAKGHQGFLPVLINKMSKNYVSENVLINKIKTFVHHDARDYRGIYLGMK